ncbi:MAG TPA: phosphoribosylamine--glycine ligase [Candidatus Omnitrophica bacterium]|nr:MAG: phosphoribosylamine--glycine ligase [Omnitrophica WOR_2 bacterium GWA2_45_18]HBR14434.1 phosphoribosylamine--glycine ligase [Candidatus Omnitrophota bacterium]
MKVLIVGSGGREHALAWKIKQSPMVKELYCAPGNGGIAQISECVDIPAEDIQRLVQFAKKKAIDLTVVGPEAPLVAGIVDVFKKEGLAIFGPSQLAAQLEGSKVFAKEFMQKYDIPTAAFESFDDIREARAFLAKAEFPLVIKADGLAAGKGVMICQNMEEGEESLVQMMEDKIFQEAGRRVIIEECLKGEEVSILAISDGKNYVLLDSSQDHKRIFDDDLGPNTGGMGAYSPAPIVDAELLRRIDESIIGPVIRGMKKEGAPFEGILYAGLMITIEGPKVLEFNVRFGDPETQVILPRWKNDLLEIMLACGEGRLNKVQLQWDPRPCVCVVMSSGGYPSKYETGKEILGLEKVQGKLDTMIFHAGTKKEGKKILTAGGRVLGVTALGRDILEAIERAYEVVEQIQFDRCFFRRDIGSKAMKHKGVRAPAGRQN